MEIRVADAGCVELEQDLVRSGFWDWDVVYDDGEVEAGVHDDACFTGCGDSGFCHGCAWEKWNQWYLSLKRQGREKEARRRD